MADDYTPTTKEVRWDFNESDTARDRFGGWGSAGAAFDRWLAAHDAEVRAAALAEQGEPADQVKQLLRDLTDPDDCSFDHHGGCQAHGYLSLQPGELCPHAEAKQLIAGWLPVPDATSHEIGGQP